jgi:hypothetical protein
MLRHPFAFGRGFDQNPCVWAPPEECGQSITRRANALIDHLAALRHDSHLAFFLVQVDGTMLQGWSPLLRLRARLRSVEPKLPPRRRPSASSYLCHMAPEPQSNTVVYGDTSTHINRAAAVANTCDGAEGRSGTSGRQRTDSSCCRDMGARRRHVRDSDKLRGQLRSGLAGHGPAFDKEGT